MAQTILNMDLAALFIGDDNPVNSQALTLKSVKIPGLEEATKNHNPGGGVLAIDIGMKKINAPMFTFKLAGMQPDVMPRFMTSRRQNYTLRGNLFDLATQEDKPCIAVINGKMTKVETSEFQKDDGVDTDYEIREIVKYILTIDNAEKYYLDFFLGAAGVRVDGVPLFGAAARNLGF